MKALWIACGTLLLLVAGLVVANRWDSPLDPEAAALVKSPPSPVPDERNLYNAVSVFSPTALRGNAGDLCRFMNDKPPANCLDRIVEDGPALADLVQKNRELEDAYLALASYPDYNDPRLFDLEAPMAPWSAVLLGHQLHLTHIALDSRESVTPEALQRLAADQRFWRRLAANPNAGLVERMVANAALRGSLVLLGELLRAGKLEPGTEAPVAALLEPWTEAERSLRPALDIEFQRMAGMFRGVEAGTMPQSPFSDPQLDRLGLAGNFFFLPNASVNALYEQFEPVLAAAGQPCTESFDLSPLPHQGDVPWTAFLRNAIGNILVSIGPPNYGYFLVRQCDLEGLRRIVSLQARVSGSPPDAIPDVLGNAGQDRLDPYTNQPMAWNPGELSITFDARDRKFKAILPWKLVP